MPKGKDKPKGKGKTKRPAKPPKGKAPSRAARLSTRPIDAEDLFAGTKLQYVRPGARRGRADEDEDDGDEEDDQHPAETEAKPLNPKQRAFAEHYAKEPNATKAAKAAGYEGTQHSIEVTGSRLLKHAEVRKYLDELLDACAAPRIADAVERHEFLTNVMRGKVKGRTTFYGETVTTYPSAQDRIRAAELLSKINGELTEKREVKGDLVVRVVRADTAPSAIGHKEGDGE